MVPVSAIATAQPVTTPSTESSMAMDRASSSVSRVMSLPSSRCRPGALAIRRGAAIARARWLPRRDAALIRAVHGGAIVDEAILQEIQQRCIAAVVGARGPVGAGYIHRRSTRSDRVPDPGEDVFAGGHGVPPRVRDHHWRKVSLGGAGRSRADVQADSGARQPADATPARDESAGLAAALGRLNRRGFAMTHAVAAMVACSAVGVRRRARSSSTTRVRRWTRSCGMSIFTGQASKHAPHRLEAKGSEETESWPRSAASWG